MLMLITPFLIGGTLHTSSELCTGLSRPVEIIGQPAEVLGVLGCRRSIVYGKCGALWLTLSDRSITFEREYPKNLGRLTNYLYFGPPVLRRSQLLNTKVWTMNVNIGVQGWKYILLFSTYPLETCLTILPASRVFNLSVWKSFDMHL